MGLAGSCRREFRDPRLDDRPHLQGRSALSRPVCYLRRHGSDVGGRHGGRQGRLPESRPDGLRQSLWHGVVFRGGLHGRQSCAPRHPDPGQHRQGEWRQSVVGTDNGATRFGQSGDAGRAARRRSDQASRCHPRSSGHRDHRASERDRAVSAASRFRQRLDAGLRSRSAERRADGRFPDLFVADDRRAPSRH
jgi:hypothetical protein